MLFVTVDTQETPSTAVFCAAMLLRTAKNVIFIIMKKVCGFRLNYTNLLKYKTMNKIKNSNAQSAMKISNKNTGLYIYSYILENI